MVLVHDGFLDAATCTHVRRHMDAGAVEPAEILNEAIEVDRGVRHAHSVDVDEATVALVEERLDAHTATLARAFGRELGTREGANFLRYGAGGFYLPHVDRAEDPSWPAAARRRVAVVVFLNDDFTGGALHIIDARQAVLPLQGRLVAFDAGLLHEVEPVVAGTRDVIVDWFY